MVKNENNTSKSNRGFSEIGRLQLFKETVYFMISCSILTGFSSIPSQMCSFRAGIVLGGLSWKSLVLMPNIYPNQYAARFHETARVHTYRTQITVVTPLLSIIDSCLAIQIIL